MPPDAPPISIVVVNYNGGEHLSACLSTLYASDMLCEIFVVDNASTDDSLALLARFALTHPAVKVLRSDVNRGYAGGVNLALPYARGNYVMALNPDIRVAPDCLSR